MGGRRPAASRHHPGPQKRASTRVTSPPKGSLPDSHGGKALAEPSSLRPGGHLGNDSGRLAASGAEGPGEISGRPLPSQAGGPVPNNDDADFGPAGFLGLMNDWHGSAAQLAAGGLSTPPASVVPIYRKPRVHPAIAARISQSKNRRRGLRWDVEANALTIVRGPPAFPGTFPAFALVLPLASLCAWRRPSAAGPGD